MLHSLRAKLIVVVGLIFVIAMTALTAVNILNERQTTMNTLEDDMAIIVDGYAHTIEEWLSAKRRALQGLIPQVQNQTTLPSYIDFAVTSGALDNAYVGYPDKTFIAKHNMSDGTVLDPTSRPWYQSAVKSKKLNVTVPYIGLIRGYMIISTTLAVFDENNKEKGVIGVDIKLDDLIQTIAKIKPTPHSSALVFNADGAIVGHEDKEWLAKNVEDYIDGVSKDKLITLDNDDGYSELLTVQHALKKVFVRQVEGTDWYLAVMVDNEEATASVWASLKLSIITALVALVVALIFVAVSITKVTNRLIKIRNAIQDIVSGEGDLSRRLTFDGKDELAQIAAAFNGFVQKIATIMREIRITSESVKMSSSEIASGNMDLSNRTEAQAASLEKTSSAMEELTSTVQQNADNAKQANQLVGSASEIALRGGNVVEQVVETMGSISGSSKKVVEIISVIDGIAFQTNILALNAAVEAARAGEQGRGFAVVASEVRNLAQRSATAAKEIKDLIDASVKEIGEGEKLVKQAGETMAQVVSSVKSVTDIVGEISSASQEQSIGIAEIGKAIVQMDEVTQQNSALVEESAAAAQSLREQSSGLSKTIGMFKLDANEVPAVQVEHKDQQAKPEVKPDIKPQKMLLAAPKKTHKELVAVKKVDDAGEWEEH